MSDEEYFNEMMTSEETIPAIRNDQELRAKLLGILKEMDVAVAREICEDVLNQITISSVLNDRSPNKGDPFVAGWGMVTRERALQLSIRRDALIWESDFHTLDDGRQIMRMSIPMEGIVNLLNEEAAIIEVNGLLSKSGADEADLALRIKQQEAYRVASMVKESPTPRKILVPIKDREPSEE